MKAFEIKNNLNKAVYFGIVKKIILTSYPKEYVIFRQGEPGDALYIIKNGQVGIYKQTQTQSDPLKLIAGVSGGMFFGEMALVSDEPRNATAKCLEDSDIFILSKGDFKSLMDSNPALAQQISATMVDRLNQNDQNKSF